MTSDRRLLAPLNPASVKILPRQVWERIEAELERIPTSVFGKGNRSSTEGSKRDNCWLELQYILLAGRGPAYSRRNMQAHLIGIQGWASVPVRRQL